MKFKSAISFALILAVMSVFSFRSIAASQSPADSKPAAAVAAAPTVINAQDLTGTLTTTGYVTINGNEARTGATILSGNTIKTGPDSDATLDLGPLGRIQMRPGTALKLTLAANNCQIEVEECGSFTHWVPAGVLSEVKKIEDGIMEVAVLPGEAKVSSGGSETVVRSGENRVFQSLDSVAVNGETVYTLNCCECEIPAGGGFFLPVWGIFGLVGAAATTAVGVGVGDDDDPVSPTRP
jgi:hypothetical protein